MTNLRMALKQFRKERNQVRLQVHRLDEAIDVIERLVGQKSSRVAGRPRRNLSVAGRKRIALAQKARWARWRRQSKPGSLGSMATPAKRTMSFARWVRVRQQTKAA
jgi:hypothetical protein